MVHRLVFAPRPPRRYWKMNDFAPEGVTFSPKPCNSSSQRNASLGPGRIASTYRLVTLPVGMSARFSNHLAITIAGMSGNGNEHEGAYTTGKPSRPAISHIGRASCRERVGKYV